MSETLSDPVDIMARTLWGEARGEGLPGITAVACVILNRANNPRWWGKDVVDVCWKPYQFSCWNENDPNRAKLLAVTTDDIQFRLCLDVARRAISDTLPDPTGNADSYYDISIPTPNWANGADRTYAVGDLRFYRLELPGLS